MHKMERLMLTCNLPLEPPMANKNGLSSEKDIEKRAP